jgi:hypothetical protein
VLFSLYLGGHLHPLVASRLPLSEARHAHELLAAGGVATVWLYRVVAGLLVAIAALTVIAALGRVEGAQGRLRAPYWKAQSDASTDSGGGPV